MSEYYVYILASRRNGTLYIGVTNDVIRRVFEHRNNLLGGFTAKYGVHDLVYVETHEDVEEAIIREKRMKRWRRAWKTELIEKDNKDWKDLWPALANEEDGSRFGSPGSSPGSPSRTTTTGAANCHPGRPPT
jgi:putative endonuclease